MTTVIEHEDGTVEMKSGIGEVCDLCECPHCGVDNFEHKEGCIDPSRLAGCTRIATRELEGGGFMGGSLFVCEEHFKRIAS